MKKIIFLIVLLALSFGGQAQWTPLDTLQTSYRSIYFINDTVGFICGNYGLIKKTTDGGNSWTFHNYSGGDDILSVYFLSLQTGFATTGYGRILETIDGGNTWVEKYYAGGYIFNMKFVEDSVGLAISSFPFCCIRLYKTVDQGESWTKVGEHHLPDYGYNGVGVAYCSDYFDENHATAGLDANLIMSTNDGGSGWSEKFPAGNSGDIRDIQYVGLDTMFATSSSGFYSSGGILRYYDGNYDLTHLSSSSMYAIQMLNSQTGYAAGDGGIYKTTDGGADWQCVDSVDYDIRSISITENSGYAISWDQVLFTGNVFKLSNLTGVPAPNSLNHSVLTCYPNPFSSQLTVSVGNSNSQSAIVELKDLFGRIISTYDSKGETSLEISTGDLSKGIYFLTMKSRDGNYIRKIVKQ